MRKIYFSILFLFLLFQTTYSQSLQLSVYSEISIVTVGPGDALYEAFGHSAIRVKDPVLRMDIVYNYGVFDFNQPNYYYNFTKGKLLYKLGKRPFQNFINYNNYYKRWMKAQVLNLTQQERQKMYQLLETNALRENADYLYDPYFNNCATKLRDITKEVLGNNVQFPTSYSKEVFTLRQLMNHELTWNTWGNFGINVALGNKLDKEITAEEYMYLPDYVFTAFKAATKNENGTSVSLIKKEETILNFKEKVVKINWYNPFFIFSLLLLIGIVITYKDQKRNKRSKWFDFIVFFITGTIGVFITFLWFFTDHKTTPNNFNLLWAFAPNILISFILLKNNIPVWISKYIKAYLLILILIPIIWISGIQQFSLALIPIIGILFLRNFYLNKLLSSKK